MAIKWITNKAKAYIEKRKLDRMVFLDYDKNSLIITYFKSGNITKINKIIKLLEKLRDNMVSRQSSSNKLKESYSIDNNQGEYQSSNSEVDSNISEINNSEKETM